MTGRKLATTGRPTLVLLLAIGASVVSVASPAAAQDSTPAKDDVTTGTPPAGATPAAAPTAVPSAPAGTPGEVSETTLKGKSPPEISALPVPEIQRITAKAIEKAEPHDVAALSPAQLAVLPAEAQTALSDEQLAALAPSQKDALATTPNVASTNTPVGEMRRGRDAIKPGIRLIGDAYSQLVKIAESPNPEGGFGAGVEIETLKGRSSFVIRKGTLPATLTSEKQFGASMLTPGVQDFYAGVDGSISTKLLPWRTFVLAFGGFGQIAKTTWQVHLADADGDPAMPTAPAVDVSADAVTAALAVGPELRYIASQGENFVEVRMFIGLGLRGVSVDQDADRKVAQARAADPRVLPGGFLKHAIGTSDQAAFSMDLALSIRINTVVLGASIPYVASDTAGLGGVGFIPAVTLRAGARLVDL